MQLSVWALSIVAFSVLFSSATPVESPQPEQSPSTTTTIPPPPSSFSSLIIPTLSATPTQNASLTTPTTSFIRQTTATTTKSQPGIPLPPSTVTAQVPTSSPVGGNGCGEMSPASRRRKRDPDVCAW